MPDSTRVLRARPITTAAATYLPTLPAIPRDLFKYTSWQEEAWIRYHTVGELNNGITWLAHALSRVRLNAAEVPLEGNEPTVLTSGPAAELMRQFAGGTPGQANIMSGFGFQLGVTGEAYLVVERDNQNIPLAEANWRVMPVTALRMGETGTRGGLGSKGKKQKLPEIKVRIGEALWRPLAEEGMATRVFREDPQFPWRPTSAVQAALPILQRIDLIDKRIVAVMVSRLATSGLLLYPQEGQFTVPEQYKEAADPFLQTFVDTASKNIANPMLASAAIPMLVGYAAELIDKWRLIKWDDLIPSELIDEREKEIKRLATTLNLPTEWLTGMSDMNHWNGALVSREAVKIYLAPYIELICDGIQKGFLYPLMEQLGEELTGPEGGRIIVWYDVAELTTPPDKSQNAKDAYDRIEIGGEALRRYLGMEESDKPDKKEIEQMALKLMLKQPATASQALAQLTGKPAPESGNLYGPEVAGQPAYDQESAFPPEDSTTAPTEEDQLDLADLSGPLTATFGPPLERRRPSPRPRAYNGIK